MKIIIAMKPNTNNFANNVVKYNIAGFNIDECRIGYQGEDDKNGATPQGKCISNTGNLAGKTQGGSVKKDFDRPGLVGRFPSNIFLFHVDQCKPLGKISTKGKEGGYSYDNNEYQVEGFVKTCKPKAPSNYGGEKVETWDCKENCPIGIMNKQSGITKSTGGSGSATMKSGLGNSIYGQYSHDKLGDNAGGLGDVGGASRYFKVFQ